MAESIQKHDSKIWAKIHRGGKESPRNFWNFVKHKLGSGPKSELHLPVDNHSSQREIIDKLTFWSSVCGAGSGTIAGMV